MRTDLNLLHKNKDDLGDLIESLELELVEDPRWDEPSDTSYLSAKDRANASIMANVEAMSATNALIDWFGKDMEGFVGFWRGPGNTPVDAAPVVRLDTEGQYALVARTIGDYLLVSADHDEFDENREALVEAGFKVSDSIDAIWGSIEESEEPNEYRNDLATAAENKAKKTKN